MQAIVNQHLHLYLENDRFYKFLTKISKYCECYEQHTTNHLVTLHMHYNFPLVFNLLTTLIICLIKFYFLLAMDHEKQVLNLEDLLNLLGSKTD